MIADADNPNLAILQMAVQALGDLTDSLVFVGGCATGLLVTRIRANPIRAAEDVDVVAQVATIAEYHGVESMLASRGFTHDTSPDAPICRWLSAGAALDVMPSQPGVLSFHIRWYPLAVTIASPKTLPSGHSIKLITAPVFLATKLEAFKGRGNGDFLVNHDLEDIVNVVDGRPALIDELRDAPEELRTYIAQPPTPKTAPLRLIPGLEITPCPGGSTAPVIAVRLMEAFAPPNVAVPENIRIVCVARRH